MSNSFNISVAPEIDALDAKVDIIDTEVDAIRNDVTSIHDINLPAVKADTGPIRNDVTAIHDTMLPSVKIDTGAIRNDVTDIHDTNLPAVKTDTGAIRNDVDTIALLINAIKLKTDLIPTSKSEYKSLYGSAVLSTSWETILEITGEGKLYNAWFYDSDGNFNIRITIDTNSMTFNGLLATTAYDTIRNIAYNSGHLIEVVTPIKTSSEILNIEFKDLLKVEIQRISASGSFFYKVVYGDI